MILVNKTRKVNYQMPIICFAIVSFFSVLLMHGFSIPGVQAQESLPIGVVYTETNIPIPNQNSIQAFRRDTLGNLTPLPGSPFPTQGAGFPNALIAPDVITPRGSDQEIIVNPEHTRLFAVNSGSNTIAVFDIRKDGSLSPVEGSPFPSGGVEPVSLGLADDFLYVVNQNLDPQNPLQEPSNSLPNYTVFRVTPRGKLIPIRNSTRSTPHGSGPTQALISPNKRVLFGAELGGSGSPPSFQLGGSGLLRSFQILENGLLRPSPNSPQPLPASEFSEFPAGTPANPLGLQVHPKESLLYVGFFTINRVGVYSYDKDTGELTFLKTVPSSGEMSCWLIINRKATRLYTSNPGDNTISVYDIEKDPTTPVEIQNVTVKGSGGIAQLTLDSTESFLQVVSEPRTVGTNDGNVLHVLKVNPEDGTVSEVSSSPSPVLSTDNSFPQGIVSF